MSGTPLPPPRVVNSPRAAASIRWANGACISVLQFTGSEVPVPVQYNIFVYRIENSVYFSILTLKSAATSAPRMTTRAGPPLREDSSLRERTSRMAGCETDWRRNVALLAE